VGYCLLPLRGLLGRFIGYLGTRFKDIGRRFLSKVVLVGLAMIGNVPMVKAETLMVGSGYAPFQSIRAAVAVAKPGDTIQVHAGTYVGDVVLDKPLTLEGVGKPIIRGSGRGSVLVVLVDKSTIKGFVIEHSGGDLQREDSGILLKSNNNRVEENELRDVLYGIYLYHSQGNTIRRNVIRGRSELELGGRGAGLHLWNSPDNVIEENTISEARDGMYIQSSNGNIIRHNRVFNLRYGLHYMFSDANRFEDNLFSHNVAGAAIMYSKRIEFRRNAFIHNRGFSSFGILFQDCDECLAEENFIIDNATGIFMEALRKSAFRRNVIAENDVALQMFSSADENVFSNNNFVENLSPLQLIGKRTTTRWEQNGRGNFWSDCDGYDLDGDGIGDVPHKVQNVFEYMEGNYPRLRLYLYSPAAQGLAMAERTFPVVKGSSEMDPAPLTKAVRLEFPFDHVKPERQAQFSLTVVSVMMLGAALAVIWRGQRR
jgi:nitrous oxidase accessory protein